MTTDFVCAALVSHDQVDSGMGFKCDEPVIPLLRAINNFPGVSSQWSCQGSGSERGYVIITGDILDLISLGHKVGEVLSEVGRINEEPTPGTERHECVFEKYCIQFDIQHGCGIRGLLEFPNSRLPEFTERISKALASSPPSAKP